ncbi:phage portal protein [Clostridium beijerinckii]|uniref:phage portal protein n=1 Tax=Clostridium beijerinckii TaxID=1520 RepID=UPI00098CAFAD|nr:phage portal protein [Clostridium beijerinckii]MBA8937752.1 SPP1 family phage portal protein [Clostridium beijerinckii]NRU41632.1 SPP1 family phage portal protein [Clostridium beijerinckii]NSB00824.1 SPP1 family phage portal protein [Clostridium beijerinckii]OOM52632.1 phage portal protein, SPP1 Gp6-like [Clostridium beijerinckii]OOM65607.1 phage portal protein, SPP1 Gp6-like [Clostridium beijerinckii]
MDISEEIIKKAYQRYQNNSKHYNDINKYYYGTTEALKDFKPIEGRSNLKVNANFVQKLVDEEATYSFGNSVTYVSTDNNSQVTKDIEYNLKNNLEDHDLNGGIELVKNGTGYEINYLDKEKKFKNRMISALDGYMYRVNEEPLFFLHVHEEDTEDGGTETFIDMYTDKQIIHYDSEFNEVEQATPHYFGIVPVGYGIVGGKEYSERRGYVEGDKTIYRTIKTIQDALETNLSDMVCEISDFRNAILKLFNARQEDEDGTKQPIIKDNAVMEFEDKETQDAEWLIKEINDAFIKNTRDDLIALIYVLTCHIDNNEKMQSNLSGIALRSRLQMLESKCRMNEKAMANIIKTRLKCLFKYLEITEGKKYDVNKIEIKFTPNVPADLTALADIVSKIPHEVMSNRSKRALIPTITDVDKEGEQIELENKAENQGMGDYTEDNNADNIVGDGNEAE